MTSVTIATDQTFAQEALASDKFVLAAFVLPGNLHSDVMNPVYGEIAAETGVKLVKVNIPDNPATVEMLSIQVAPTLIALRGGKVMDQLLGALPKASVAEFISRTQADPTEGMAIEEYKERAAQIYKAMDEAETAKKLLLARRKEILYSGVSATGGLMLAFAAATTGYSPFGLVAAAFNAVRGVSVFRNKTGLSDLYNSRSGRIFSAVSNAATLASGFLQFAFTAGSGDALGIAIATPFALIMSCGGYMGLRNDFIHITGTGRPPAPPSPQQASEDAPPPPAPAAS